IEILDKITIISKGDLRRAITLLQYLKYNYDKNNRITMQYVYDYTNVIPDELIYNLINNNLKNKKTNIQELKECTNKLNRKGYCVQNILEKLCDLIIEDDEFTDKNKALICNSMAILEQRISEGADEY